MREIGVSTKQRVIATAVAAIAGMAMVAGAVACSGKRVPSEAGIKVFHADFHARIEAPVLVTADSEDARRVRVTLRGDAIAERTLAETRVAQAPESRVATIDFRDLPRGRYTLVCELLGRRDEVIARRLEHFKHAIDGAPRVGFDESNALHVDGKPVFPVTTWWPTFGAGYDTDIDRLYDRGIANAAEAGVPLGDDPAREFSAALDECGAVGALAIGPTGSGPPAGATVTEVVSGTVGHRNLIAWMWLDEPEYGPVDPAVVRAWTDQTHAADPNRPVVVNLVGSMILGQGGDRRVAARYSKDPVDSGRPAPADWISTDYYPLAFRKRFGMDTQVAFDNFAAHLTVLRAWTKDLYPIKTFIEVAAQSESGTEEAPEPRQVWAETWIAVTRGVNAISWFPHDGSIHPETPAVQAKAREYLEHFAPVLSEPTVNSVQAEQRAGGRVDTLVKVHGGRTYVFAVNRDVDDAAEVRFVCSRQPVSVTAFGEDRRVMKSGRGFSDRFEPYGVHIYELDF